MPVDWRNRSSELAVPLSRVQTDILRLLASHRDAESYVAGVASTALADLKTLQEAGYGAVLLRELPSIYAAEVFHQNASTRLEWVADSDFRHFPAMRDEIFGYVLHPVDLATNKAMAAAGRREVRDLIDLVTIHKTILPLRAVVWVRLKSRRASIPKD